VGVPWGIEHTSSRYDTMAKFLEQWTSFATADICQHFVVPFDAEFHTFTRQPDGTVSVGTESRPDLLAEINELSCGDGSYDEFESLTEVALFVPDRRGKRSVPRETWRYRGNIIVDSLDALHWMGSDGRRLARELHQAGQLAEKHGLIVGISY
jgi:hypothetical protein